MGLSNFGCLLKQTDQLIERNRFFLALNLKREFIIKLFMGQDACG